MAGFKTGSGRRKYRPTVSRCTPSSRAILRADQPLAGDGMSQAHVELVHCASVRLSHLPLPGRFCPPDDTSTSHLLVSGRFSASLLGWPFTESIYLNAEAMARFLRCSRSNVITGVFSEKFFHLSIHRFVHPDERRPKQRRLSCAHYSNVIRRPARMHT